MWKSPLKTLGICSPRLLKDLKESGHWQDLGPVVYHQCSSSKPCHRLRLCPHVLTDQPIPNISKYFQMSSCCFPMYFLINPQQSSIYDIDLRPVISVCDHFPLVFFGQVVFMPSPVTQITQSRLSHLFGQPLMSPQDAPVPLIAILAQNFGSGYSQLPNPFAIQIVLSGERGRFFRFFRSEGLAPRLICKLFFQARIDYGYYMILWLLWPLLWAIIAINIHKP